MTPLSSHFTLQEMVVSQDASRRGIDNTPSVAVLTHLQATCRQAEVVRTLLVAPMLVSSGYRSTALNTAIGGVPDSAHCAGDAMDFICPGFGTPLDICAALAKSTIPFDQVIEEGTWVHISFAPMMRRQVLSKNPAGGYVFGLRSPVKLGRKAPVDDPRTLKLARYMAGSLPAVPPMHNWGVAVPADGWGMMMNDTLGDCTAAAVGHIIMAASANRGVGFDVTPGNILNLYEKTGGYVPGDPTTDNGARELDVLNYWRSTGIAGHKILAYAALNPKDPDQLRTAIYLFGSIYAGVRLPVSAQDQAPWYVTDPTLAGDAVPNSWGGHAVPIIGYDDRAFACVTWGAMQWMTEDWWLAYGDEAYALISADWSPPDGVAPNHFDMDQLKADLSAVTQGA